MSSKDHRNRNCLEADPDLFINLKDINDLRRTALASLDELRTTPKKVEFEEVIDKRKNRLANKTELIVCVDTEEQYEMAQKYSSLVFSSNENLLQFRGRRIVLHFHQFYFPIDEYSYFTCVNFGCNLFLITNIEVIVWKKTSSKKKLTLENMLTMSLQWFFISSIFP